MKIGDTEIHAVASESMGVRSLCTQVTTPDITILFDPSAGLAMRFGLEPHPLEYDALKTALADIFELARKSDVLSISHYHYDHVRPTFTNYRYNFSSLEDTNHMFENKRVLLKDHRDNINPSQRKRAYYFRKHVGDAAEELVWTDGREFEFGDTTVSYSESLPHGPDAKPLGYVVVTCVKHKDATVVFAPDIQGPSNRKTLSYLLSLNSDVMIVGGPPIYLPRHLFDEQNRQTALFCLVTLANAVETLVVDHHLMRSLSWKEWLKPSMNAAEESGNCVLCMAELEREDISCLEADRQRLYEERPPSQDFINWTNATDEYKRLNEPPL
ncbi:MAG: hypothetical protein R6V83_04755 [Candidatus Thorarchaeota archaeon]